MATTTLNAAGGPVGAYGSQHLQSQQQQQQQQQPQRLGTRPRSKSTYSVTSDHSESKRSGREKLRESHDEKRNRVLSETTKANPNAAINELQPIAQQLAPSTMASLRHGQHTDMQGNLITDPDPSNPTRRRMERPLETIMSFEAAIDKEYRLHREANRQSVHLDSGATDYNGYESRRSSAYWGPATEGHQSHHRNRASNYFPENQNPYNAPRSRYGPRQSSDPALNRYNTHGSVYSTPGYGQTRETINTGGSGGSASDPWHNSTDPSSDNSSIERMKAEGGHGHHGGDYSQYGAQQQREPISENGHYTYNNTGGGGGGANGYNPTYMQSNHSYSQSGGYPGQQFDGRGAGGGPQPPPKNRPMTSAAAAPAAPRPVLKLGGGSSSGAPADTDYMAGTPPRRKSWLKRTFSKGGK